MTESTPRAAERHAFAPESSLELWQFSATGDRTRIAHIEDPAATTALLTGFRDVEEASRVMAEAFTQERAALSYELVERTCTRRVVDSPTALDAATAPDVGPAEPPSDLVALVVEVLSARLGDLAEPVRDGMWGISSLPGRPSGPALQSAGDDVEAQTEVVRRGLLHAAQRPAGRATLETIGQELVDRWGTMGA